MKRTVRILFITLLGLSLGLNAFAYKNISKSTKTLPKATLAGCAAGAAFTDLDVNNVRCRINTGGDMWWDLQGVAKYFIPGNTPKTSMFSASLWIGGLDENGQLKLAAQRYRGSGNDYWPGPLTIDGNANISAEVCSAYDKHFKITKAQVEEFRDWWNDKASYPEYQIPEAILKWPGNGDEALGQSPYLAPYFDNPAPGSSVGNGVYDPENDGDYPYYVLSGDESVPCKSNETIMTPESIEDISHGGRKQDWVLKGDETVFWIFNDKGNIHSETQGSPIGFEIRAQAFGFSTNDEVNSMTFYTYEIINRSLYELSATYFSQWVDTDLGDAWDDYVGCDVKRGLGYCYNGDAVDGSGKEDEYGVQPPAVGVDFFQGPYMDDDFNNDGTPRDNPKFTGDCSILNSGYELDQMAINGVNFGDSIANNERFGMRRFVYHSNCGSGPTCDPEKASEYYNMLRGIWKDGIKMMYGGNAHPNSGATGPACDFMFPELSDPCNWGTKGIQPPDYSTGAGGTGPAWTEANEGNPPYDRRFMQSAGPFTLKAGAVNYITVGIPWARANAGGPWASVKLLQTVDDKCQKLFENCFKVLEGPDHPRLIVQELDREILLYLKNKKNSNNEFEDYQEVDANIITPDSLVVINGDTSYVPPVLRWDSLYKFEGYQIFQLANATVTDLTDLDVARQVAQCDIKNGVANIINYEYNQDLQANVPIRMVEGSDAGLKHSFRITEDQFATGDKRLVNHKQYYFVAVAYGYNNYLTYTQDANNPNGLKGQKNSYLIGRKQPDVITGIPHITSPEGMGTNILSAYGNGPRITRVEGQGNGGMSLEWTKESIDKLMDITAPPFIVENPTYKNGKGPINVKVVDPLSVKKARYELRLIPDPLNGINKARWRLDIFNLDPDTLFILSDQDISVPNEQLLIQVQPMQTVTITKDTIINGTPTTITLIDTLTKASMDLGLSVQVTQTGSPGDAGMENNGYLESSITFADSSKIWLSGIPDVDNPGPWNWIRSGNLDDASNPQFNDWDMPGTAYDPNEDFEKTVERTWCPYNLVSLNTQDESSGAGYSRPSKLKFRMAQLSSVNVVITKDKSKWTRCPVIEMCPDQTLSQQGVAKFNIRGAPSVDKNGNPADTTLGASNDPNSPNFINAKGMGWFPGYAYDLETGERLNLMFGEDSWLVSENGRDMLWNPTDLDPADPFNSPHVFTNLGQVLFGGKHYLYVMSHTKEVEPGYPNLDGPAYDFGKWARELIPDENYRIYAYANAMWVNLPMAVTGKEWLNNDATIRIRVAKPYARYFATSDETATISKNNDWPMYSFTTEDIATVTQNNETAKTALDLINVVPNPYYAFSNYESDQLDSRVRITNLPEKCTISIYTVGGTLVKQITKDAVLTSVDWDVKNYAGIPVASGIYLIHVDAPGIGEKVIKWFGVQRPVDLNAF